MPSYVDTQVIENTLSVFSTNSVFLLTLYYFLTNKQTVSTCLERLKKMPLEPGGALVEGVFYCKICLSINPIG